jgi:hypothetical protein
MSAGDETALDCSPKRRLVFGNAGAGLEELFVDRPNLKPAGVVGLSPQRGVANLNL